MSTSITEIRLRSYSQIRRHTELDTCTGNYRAQHRGFWRSFARQSLRCNQTETHNIASLRAGERLILPSILPCIRFRPSRSVKQRLGLLALAAAIPEQEAWSVRRLVIGMSSRPLGSPCVAVQINHLPSHSTMASTHLGFPQLTEIDTRSSRYESILHI